ncbi:MAG: archaeal proteasome endopeptidase complex subunit alpha [Nanoarchaeota archaeon]|nr:archaeal proteasome endopeptidase complex subunit alpha [Nanoarchaeota archaeon]MBU1103539.1 archaeal proteasome endopeptidase complex subunit alpha [Nanoarchaeota archaeon]
MPSEMQHQVMGYDRAATMFSPDGHLLQAEYAEKTVRLGSASIGLLCKDGVVIIADKRVRDKLISPESAHKIFEIDSHILATAAGILADARVLIDQAQVLAQQNRVTYGSPAEPITIIRMIADRKQFFTQYGGARPYGVSLMLCGVNKGKSYLYASDVIGSFFSYRANAIGENDEKIKEVLRKDYKEGMSIEEGIKFGLKVFKDLLGKNFEVSRFEVGYVKSSDEKLARLQGEELKRFVK